MNFKHCLQVLRLEQAASKSDVEQAYREMIDTWRPERFTAGSQLRVQAQEKIKEINIAYQNLMTFFSTHHGMNKLSPLEKAAPHTAGNTARVKASAFHKTDYTDHDNLAGYRSRPLPQSAFGAGGIKRLRSSMSSKHLWVALLILMAMASMLIIRYISNLNEVTFVTRPQSSVLKRLSSETGAVEKAKTSKDVAGKPSKVIFRPDDKKPAAVSKVFEIHLKEGNVVFAQHWWEQGNMIMYTTKYGTMGVEKSTVEKIVTR
jgi:hypothetical protein